MATRKSKYSDDQFVRALDPRDPDTQYLGVEPSFSVQPKDENRKIVLRLLTITAIYLCIILEKTWIVF